MNKGIWGRLWIEFYYDKQWGNTSISVIWLILDDQCQAYVVGSLWILHCK